MNSGDFIKLIGLLVVSFIILPQIPTPLIVIALKPLWQDNVLVSTSIPSNTISVNETIYIALPARIFRELQGRPITSIIASPCYSDELVVLPKIIPRRFLLTWLPTLNTSIPFPDIDYRLTEEDVLLINIPTQKTPIQTPQSPSRSTECPWSRFAAKAGIRARYVVTLNRGTSVLSVLRGLTSLNYPITFSIYFDHYESRKPLITSIPFDMELLTVISSKLGVSPPAIPSQQYKSTNKSTIVEVENALNTWARNIHSKLSTMGVEKSISIRYEQREGFIYDPVEDRIVHEITDKLSEYKAYSELLSVNPQYYLINGGGGPTQYYVFTLILLNNTQLPSGGITRNTYLGYYIYSTTIYIRANTTDPSKGSRLIVEIKLVNTTTGRVISTRTYTYYLGSTPVDITLYPSIPYTEGGINITISLKYDYSLAPPYVATATLQFIKMYKNMPTPQTVSGALRLLSFGLYWYYISNGTPPYILPITPRASLFLSPRHNPVSIGYDLGGNRADSLSIDTGSMNGVYYNDVAPKAWLRIDICGYHVYDYYPYNVTVNIKVKINGLTYTETGLTIPYCFDCPIRPCRLDCTQIDIPLPLNPVEGPGPLITIERQFNVSLDNPYLGDLKSNTHLPFDAMIEYWYAPEVVNETNWIKWLSRRYPWDKIELSLASTSDFHWNFAKGKASIILDGPALLSEDNGDYVVKLLYASIYPISYLESRMSTSLDVRNYGCNIKKFEGQSYEEYVGAAVTGWSILYTGLEFLKLLGLISIPEPVSKLLFVADLALAIVSSSKEQTTSYQDGILYVCKWSSGLFDDFHKLELENFITVDKTPDKRPCFGIEAIVDNYKTTYFATRCVPEFNDASGSINEPLGFYGKPPSEMIYG
jgi:hypothetical protein